MTADPIVPAVVAECRFVGLGDCVALHDRSFRSAPVAQLKNTVLPAPEGTHFDLAGAPAASRQRVLQGMRKGPQAGAEAFHAALDWRLEALATQLQGQPAW